jgi:SecD/SecF fusion protein
MENRGLVIVLTAFISALCLFYLSFTFVARQIQHDAIGFATDEQGIVHLDKKQVYLDSMWNKEVYHVLGMKYTYKEVKDNELSLGLDLQGGMHVTLEVSPVEIIRSLSGDREDEAFKSALEKAVQLQKTSQKSFSDLFFTTFKSDYPSVRLASIFANASTRGRITARDTDQQVIDVVNGEIEHSIERSFTILRNRLDQFGTTQPNIQRLPGTGRIQIEIPGADNPQRVRKLLQGVAKLDFWDVVEPSALNESLLAINDLLIKDKTTVSIKNKSDKSLSTLLGDSTTVDADSLTQTSGLDSLANAGTSYLFSLANPPGSFRYYLRDTSRINAVFKRQDVRNLLPRNINVYWSQSQEETGHNIFFELYFLDIGKNRQARLTGEVITDARNTIDEHGRPAVTMTMNAVGTRIWAKWTAQASGKTPKGRIAIVLDNIVYSAPSVNSEIPNGNSQITGNFTLEETKDLANILKAGSLPAPTRIVEEAIIGPTLGKVAQDQGFISIVSGLLLVVLFMILYYGKAGVVADVALLFNLFFIVGILAQLDASLTLPGIAGIVLTMGMAVDANVIIYERIREERRVGKQLREAIHAGFKKSFWTIFDSNITTFLTALMLYVFGQGPVKGFAITLMVGIITTFFTAVYLSRVLIQWMISKKGDESNVTFQTPISTFNASALKIDFISKRKFGYTFSSIFIAIGLIFILTQGLNLGVDFTGGRSFIVAFNKPVIATDMKVALSESFEKAGVEVKNYGSNNVMKITTSYLIGDDSENADEKVKAALISGIENFGGMKFTEASTTSDANSFAISSSNKVGATIADDITKASVESALLSLAMIFLYILIRFTKWQFSAGAIISLTHDALFVFAAFAIARALGISFEIDQVFVAAILTVIGYSINDTVIIFDRIREYLHFGNKQDKKLLFNDAINSTLNRTLITSGTTLLVVVALLIFGGEVLRGFSFALLVGIGIGTYSSIFIAAPVVVDFDMKNKTNHDTSLQSSKSLASTHRSH